MANPEAATLSQLRNIQTKTGRTIPELHAVLADSGLQKTGERRSLLMERFKLGYGDANAVALFYGKPLPSLGSSAEPVLPAEASTDPLDAIYTGAKAHLRPLHEAVVALLKTWGEFDQSAKKSYISLRRKKQFAMVGPATKDLIEIGINAKDLPPHERLKVQPPGSMCQATTRIASVSDLDAHLQTWLKQAFDAAA
jgi:hypothetical protein